VVGLSSRDDEDTGHVIAAVAMFWSGLRKERMLESASLVGHGHQVTKVRLGNLA
jgi:hypothetical protein